MSTHRSWRTAALVMAGALAAILVACGGEPDIDEILVSGPELADLNADSAVLVAVTDRKVVCAVAYGLTEEYGAVSADRDMAPQGHTDHDHLLVGLQPDTVYHYRWSLFAPDGRAFQSKDMTFRTPVAETSSSQAGNNLALLTEGARVVGTSSVYGGGDNGSTWGGDRAVDGDPSMAWSSDGDGDDAWIEIELPAEIHVTSVGFWTRTMGTSAEIFSFQIVTDDGETHGPFRLDGPGELQYFDADLTARRLRFEVIQSSGGNTGAVDIQVFGEPSR
ncbi:MAG: discoidin domain-containing protein [Chloroflexi bacterium]|nr:discoidin domain-containing protein [Chloroflexota bacterium]